ncbi:MAG TPA: hypothetical protein PKJ62_03260 [Bacteroidia bacterium]|nr:hypothetical protein [Bacteroidia bacterium]HNS12520.1 hypothetical protein [Bacteroidia bacterium]
MGYYTVDIPTTLVESDYNRILKSVISKLSAVKGIEAVYQIGGIGTPGISDLDLVVIFSDDLVCNYNLHEHLSKEEKYLFIHRLYGCSEKNFHESSRFSFFHNYNLLSGKEIQRDHGRNETEINLIKTQIALEYMLKMYINIMLQKEYGILQVRSLLLHGKALKFDLDFLSVNAPVLEKQVNTLLSIRNTWFSSGDSIRNLTKWFEEFVVTYPEVLSSVLDVRGVYMHGEGNFKIAGNITMSGAESLACIRHGVKLPAFAALFLGKKYFRAQNRFNTFEIKVPFKSKGFPESLLKYFKFQSQQREYNRKFLPHFYPLSSSLLA